jgi:S-formylglutathione hydrolase FrmB
MEQLVPWIDFNLRTVAKKQSRAITGLSMGGFGAIHYAELYSDNFVYAASFSGALDLLNTDIQNIILNLVINHWWVHLVILMNVLVPLDGFLKIQ